MNDLNIYISPQNFFLRDKQTFLRIRSHASTCEVYFWIYEPTQYLIVDSECQQSHVSFHWIQNMPCQYYSNKAYSSVSRIMEDFYVNTVTIFTGGLWLWESNNWYGDPFRLAHVCKMLMNLPKPTPLPTSLGWPMFIGKKSLTSVVHVCSIFSAGLIFLNFYQGQ